MAQDVALTPEVQELVNAMRSKEAHDLENYLDTVTTEDFRKMIHDLIIEQDNQTRVWSINLMMFLKNHSSKIMVSDIWNRPLVSRVWEIATYGRKG